MLYEVREDVIVSRRIDTQAISKVGNVQSCRLA